MACLQVLEEIFKLLEGSSTVRWYEVGVDAILRSANKIVFNQNMVGRLSAIHAYCALSLANQVVMSQLRARGVRGSLPVVLNLEEQLFILKVYDWLCLGDEPERTRRQARPQGNPDTDREASSPQYLRNLLLNGPLQNFSIMAFHLVPHLKRKEAAPEIAWMVLHKLMAVPGLANATDSVVLGYFGMVRARVHKEVVVKEGRESQSQLDLLGMVDTVADWLGLPTLPMPDPVILPQPDSGAPIPPNRSGYAPVYI
jgi:hypothetical protein